jgi:hypothetical protein
MNKGILKKMPSVIIRIQKSPQSITNFQENALTSWQFKNALRNGFERKCPHFVTIFKKCPEMVSRKMLPLNDGLLRKRPQQQYEVKDGLNR